MIIKTTLARLVLLSLLFSTLTLSSCVQYKFINIQVLKPSKFSVTKDFVQPVIVAGIHKGVQGSPESLAQAALDSLAALEACMVLAENLAESPWFQGLNLPVKQYYRDDSSHLILPYPWEKVESMAASENADLVISLEYIKVTPQSDAYPFWDGATRAYYGYLSMNVYAYWRVYNLYDRKVMADYLHRDTLVWEKTDYYRIRVGDQLPGFFSAASYSGYVVGSEYAKKIAPSWMDDQRLYFFKGPKQMAKAAEFVSSNQWLEAASQWQAVLQNPKPRSKDAAKAAFNMALANEMLGKFDIALEWLNKSDQYFPLPETEWYRRIIQHRIKLMERL